MKRILIMLAILSILVGCSVGCSSRASNFRKAFNTLAAVQAGYNGAGPILESANIPEEKKASVEAIDKTVHDLIDTGWRTLIAYKERSATEDQVKAVFHSLLEALRNYSNVVDSEAFKKTIQSITIVLEIYLNYNPQDANLIQPTVDQLNVMAAK